ncbi:hypothetical protein OA387_01265 [Prochlorococcus sp. AH-716-M10]|nr:hypothetical protein [Prochlorococcus sp. AH-716-M10]
MTDIKNLEIKLKLCTNFIVKEVIALDPVIRRQWLFTYKGIVDYVDSNTSDLSQEQVIGASIYRDLIEQVEEFIKIEKFEGQNYNRYKSRDPSDSKYEVIYQKRLEQMKEDFPDPEVFIEK